MTYGQLAKAKELLHNDYEVVGTKQDMLPILHNNGMIILQFSGWSINLLADGTWYWEATDGG